MQKEDRENLIQNLRLLGHFILSPKAKAEVKKKVMAGIKANKHIPKLNNL